MPVFIDKIKKVIFITSHKCGYTTLWGVFSKYRKLFSANNDTNQLAHYQHKINLKTYNDYDVIIIIRNPFKRLVSAFQHWIIINKCHKKKDHNYHNMYVDYPYETFTEFVDILMKEKDGQINDWMRINDSHFKYQWISCCNKVSNKPIDTKYIDIDDLSETIKKYYGEYPDIKRKTLKDTDSDKYVYDTKIDDFNIINGVPEYNYYYNKDIINKVRKIYETDFEFFKSIGFNYEDPPI